MQKLLRECVAEWVGTFALVFFAAGAAITTVDMPDTGARLIILALTNTLVLGAFVTGCMRVSGSQFNPAVSIALAAIGKQSVRRAGVFILTQLLASASAVGMLMLIFTPQVANAWDEATRTGTNAGATMGSFTLEGNVMGLLALEALQAFALMFVILTTVVSEPDHKLGGWCIGIVVGVCVLAFGPITGSSMNPARTFGPALYGHWDLHWVYWLGPVAGTLAACAVHRFGWKDVDAPASAQPPIDPT